MRKKRTRKTMKMVKMMKTKKKGSKEKAVKVGKKVAAVMMIAQMRLKEEVKTVIKISS